MGKHGGRAKGCLNRSKAEPKALAQKLGINPLEILLLLAAGRWKELGYKCEKVTIHSPFGENTKYSVPVEVRAKAAADACKYLYSQLRNIEGKLQTEVVDRPLEHLTDEELDKL